jgi:hypothetical protein
MAEIPSIVKELFDLEVSRMRPRYFALRHKEEISIVKCEPGEYGRLRVEETDIRKYLDDLDEHVEGVPACLVLNADECGVWNFGDAENKLFIVPFSMRDSTKKYGIDRSET